MEVFCEVAKKVRSICKQVVGVVCAETHEIDESEPHRLDGVEHIGAQPMREQNAIEIISSSCGYSELGIEHGLLISNHIGQSNAGYHYGIEVEAPCNDLLDGTIWSKPFVSIEEAKAALPQAFYNRVCELICHRPCNEDPFLIERIWNGEWHIDNTRGKTRLLLGQSHEGYHYGIESSYGDGYEENGWSWSKAYPMREEALGAYYDSGIYEWVIMHKNGIHD